MSYDEDFMPTLEETANEVTAYHQVVMDVLYRIGCQYDISKPDMALLCQLVGVNIDEFLNHSGVSK